MSHRRPGRAVLSGRRRPGATRWTALLSATVLAAVAAVTFGSATAAGAVESQCPANWFCVWTDADYQGNFARFQSGATNLNQNPIGGTMFGDRISSVYNRTGSTWCLYDNANYGGSPRSIPRYALSGHKDNWLGDNGWNDRISSLRVCPS